MKLLSEGILRRLRAEFPTGTRIELVSMDDPQAPPVGTKGTVRLVDAIGSLVVDWDNGSGLNKTIYGRLKKLSKEFRLEKGCIYPIEDDDQTGKADSVSEQGEDLDTDE